MRASSSRDDGRSATQTSALRAARDDAPASYGAADRLSQSKAPRVIMKSSSSSSESSSGDGDVEEKGQPGEAKILAFTLSWCVQSVLIVVDIVTVLIERFLDTSTDLPRRGPVEDGGQMRYDSTLNSFKTALRARSHQAYSSHPVY